MPGLPADLLEVKKKHISDFLAEKDGKPYCVDARYRAVRAFFNWAIDRHYAVQNPVEECKRPSLPKPEIKQIEGEDFKKALNYFPKDTFLGNEGLLLILL